MKFVYFGYDFMLPSIQRLIEDGHQLAGIFSFPCDNVFNFNQQCQDLAGHLNIPFIQSPATETHLKNFLDGGCNLFLAAGYPHKIPAIDETQARAINIHPTHLPKGRGIMPIPHIIREHVDRAAGFTIHKMTQDFDAGDIIAQHKITLDKTETVETYSAKISIHAPDLLSQTMQNLETLWDSAQKQNEKEATHIKMPTEQDRLLDWNASLKNLDATGRAFGRFGCLAHWDNQLWVVYEYNFWHENHKLEPGTIAAQTSREIIIAAKDGFFCIKSCQVIEEPKSA